MQGIKQHHKIHSRAEFLNKPFFHSDASIFSEVEVVVEKEEINLNLSLKIKDCYNAISITLNAGCEEGLDNTTHKLNVMIEHLEVLKRKLREGHEVYKKVTKEKDESTITS